MGNAQELTSPLESRCYGTYRVAACPVCRPARMAIQNALTLADGRNGSLLLNCKKRAGGFRDNSAAVDTHPFDYRPRAAPFRCMGRQAKRKRDARLATLAKDVMKGNSS